jgi:hypothetical protein
MLNIVVGNDSRNAFAIATPRDNMRGLGRRSTWDGKNENEDVHKICHFERYLGQKAVTIDSIGSRRSMHR